MTRSIARTFKHKMTLVLKMHHPYGQAYGWRHSISQTQFLVLFQVRGAPAIAIVGCLSLAVELLKDDFDNIPNLVNFIVERLEYLVTSRPTAVNMKEAAVRFSDLAKEQAKEITDVKELKNL